MPAELSYPGVYISEVASGIRTITGVSTSVTAFIGRALRGSTDGVAESINSFADFERLFGGLWKESMLGYAVSDFYRNGGQRALIVRVYKDKAGEAPVASLTISGRAFVAASKGKWGSNLKATLTLAPNDEVAQRLGAGVTAGDLFELLIEEKNSEGQVVRQEQILNVTTVESARRVDRVLAAESRLLRWADPSLLPMSTPSAGSADALAAGDGDAITNIELTAAVNRLDKVDIFNLLCVPDLVVDRTAVDELSRYCQRRRAFFIVDFPSLDVKAAADLVKGLNPTNYAAAYFPRYRKVDSLRGNAATIFPVCGMIAGVYARTDAERGVWKAPAGLDATLLGAPELIVSLNDPENGELNPLGLNCLRSFPDYGRLVWGARTLDGNDAKSSEWKYVPVRRTALFIEESLYRGTQWVVFEPNDEPLWAQIRLNIGAFLHGLFRQGAFQGTTPKEAYLVKCDKETTTQADINLGIVNILVGFAPLKPAEFVVVKIQQMAGQLAT